MAPLMQDQLSPHPDPVPGVREYREKGIQNLKQVIEAVLSPNDPVLKVTQRKQPALRVVLCQASVHIF